MKNSNDTIGNRTRNLPTCSAVPQPTAPPHARHSCITVLQCDTVLLGKESLTMQWIIVCSSSGSSGILQLLAHSDDSTIILQNVSNVSSNNTASQSKMLESSWADLLMITGLVYHNHQ
jgi:hypothetical protein